MSTEVEVGNKNQALIDGLRKAADFLESRPALPYFGEQRISLFCWNDKDKLREAARTLGSFDKVFTDHYFELRAPMNEAVYIDVLIDREQVCKRAVIWDCPDDESLLKLVAPKEEGEDDK